jgi:hypothetical protein
MIHSRSDEEPPRTIWEELESWGQGFALWQKLALNYAVRLGHLTEIQLDDTYSQFLHDHGLAKDPGIEVPRGITGRPASSERSPIRLTRISNLQAINALPSTAALTFSPALTVVYGGNGVGKSGFARILSNVCFSRAQHAILPNVYENAAEVPPNADITIADGSQTEIPMPLQRAMEHSDFKRIAVFDTSVARTLLADQHPLGFKPIGFDVFPEMARVYGELVKRLTADIQTRTKQNSFDKSFLGPTSNVSELVASLSAESDLMQLREMGAFGEAEEARIEEVQRQIQELQSKSALEAISQLNAAKRDILALQGRLKESRSPLMEEKRADYRAQISDAGTKARLVAEHGADSFKQVFLNSTGSPEWERFLAAAYSLANVEGPNYPNDDDHCLLCHRALDAKSAALIRRFWQFLASEARQEADAARARVDESVRGLIALQLTFFSEDTTVRGHVTRLNPNLAREIEQLLAALDAERWEIVKILKSGASEIPISALPDVSGSLDGLLAQIEGDITRLQREKVEDVLKALEAERVTLRHRQVLSQLLPEIEKFVSDSRWVRTASGPARQSLNTRALTDKEAELFRTVIARSYKEQLACECKALDCGLPVEFQTRGERGQTIRSLSIKGGHSPNEILSEGEQRAVALADFLTEIGLNPGSAGIVLDDPVTSQDHQRKERIARRLVSEAKARQVVIFTHDLVFLTMLAEAASNERVDILTHWVERDGDGRPGQVSLDDCPATTPQYRNTAKAGKTLAEARAASGSRRVQLIQRGMGELRRTIEELVPHFLLKQVVKRWEDRIMVTALKKVNWDDSLVTDIINTYEDISAYIEGHTHTEEKAGAPPEPGDLEDMIGRVNGLIGRARAEKVVRVEPVAIEIRGRKTN